MDLSLVKSLGLRGGIRNLDLISLGSVAGLALMGLLAVYTATVDPEDGGLLRAPSELFNRQIVFCFLAGLVLLATMVVDYRHFKIYAGVLYIGCLILLIFVLTPLAETVRGSQRWISLGLFKLQPSELAKPVLLVTLAAYLSDRKSDLQAIDFVRCIGLTAPYALLVFLQPDFGTMLVLAAIMMITLMVAGADWRHLSVLMASGVVGVAFLFNVGVVHDYQRARLMAFLDPARDPYRAGYNYQLTRQAVGNGGLTGTGILCAPEQVARREARIPLTCTNFDFVPEKHTDFVFTVIAEQMGFVGGASLIALYGVLFVRGLRAAGQARDLFGTFVATGTVGYLAFQAFVNIGMTLGLVPITGIPLPFVSYGGSSAVTSAIAAGLILSVRMRRFAQPS